MNLEEVKKIIDSHEIISFDIFDTLLTRPYVNPSDLFKHLELYTKEYGFAKERVSAESRVRKNLNNDKQDVTLTEIYNEIFPKYRHFKDLELELEMQVLKRNEEIWEIYNYAIEHKKRVIIVSDMYLEDDFLFKVLKDKGYEKFEKIYVSSRYGKLKYTGDLYKVVLNDLKVESNKILHIGDHEISDYEKAIENGITAYKYKKISEQFFEKQENKKFLNFYNNNADLLEVSIILALIIDQYFNIDCTVNENDYWKYFGYLCAGPVCYGYSYFILENAKNNKIKDLIFVARDGYTLNRIFPLFKNNDINAFYVYAQRILKVKCLLNWTGAGNLDLLINIFKEKSKEFAEKMPENFNSDEDKEKFVKDNIELLKPYAAEYRREYVKYLKDLGINVENNIALVDTGSNTFSAQVLLSQILDKELLGIYWQVYGHFGDKNGIKYVKYNNEEFWFKIWDMMEFMFTSPEVPIKGLENGKPIYQSNPTEQEIKRTKVYPFVSDGAVDFSKNMIERFGKFLPSLSSQNITKFIISYFQNLSKIDEEMIGKIYHGSDSNHSIYKISLLDEIKFAAKREKEKRRFMFKIFGIRIFKIMYGENNLKIKFFSRIPFLSCERVNKIWFIKLFNFIKLLKIEEKNSKIKIKLFNFIPFIRISEKQ